MARIFDRPGNLRPSQFTAVAERRFGDATALCATNDNERANGALYLCGFVVEILLKAQLLRKYQHLGRQRSSEVADAERNVWNLIWRSHDLNELLGHLPHVVVAVKTAGERRRKATGTVSEANVCAVDDPR